MNKITKWLYILTIFLVLFTLAKDLPPYRIYLLDFMLVPFFFAMPFQFFQGVVRRLFRWQRIDTFIVVLFISITIAFIFSEDRVHSIVSYMDWVRVISLYFCSRIVFIKVVSEKAWRGLAWVSAAVLLAIGIIQAVTGTSFGLIGNYFGSGMDQGVTANVMGVGSMGRISGTTSNPIIFAMWVTMFSLIVAADLNTKRRHVYFVILFSISAMVVLSTLSRGAILAFVLSWFILAFINRRELVRIVFTSMITMTFLLPLLYLGIEKYNIGEAATMLRARVERQELLEEDSARVRVIKMGVTLLGQPKIFIVGTGPDNMVLAYNKYGLGLRSTGYNRYSHQRSGIHNVWMKMFVEYGVLSIIALVLIWIDGIRRMNRLWKAREIDPSAKTWAAFLFAFTIPYLIVDCGVYESAMSYHVLIPLFAMLGYLVTRTSLYGPHRVAVRTMPMYKPKQ